MSTAAYAHIEFRANGAPFIAGTRIRVSQIAVEQVGFGWSALEIQEQHPFLTLGQIHGALTYYYDHREEMDRAIESSEAHADSLREKLEDPVLQERLRQAKEERAQS